MMVTVMVTAEITGQGYSPWLAVVAGLACSCIVGVLSYLIAVRPILAFNRFSFGWLVSTLGFAVIVENAAAYFWGPTSIPFPTILNSRSIHFGDSVLTGQQMLAIVVAIIFTVGFELVRKRTLFGKIGMATAADPEMASGVRHQHHRRRDRRLRGLGALRRRGGRADRPQHLRQPLPRRHLRDLRVHRHDDRRRHRAAGGGHGRRGSCSASARKAPTRSSTRAPRTGFRSSCSPSSWWCRHAACSARPAR